MTEFYIDAENHVLGRLASSVAKRLSRGDKVFVVNAEKVVVSGNPKWVFENYKKKIDRGSPTFGPFYPKRPDRIFKRSVRGMISKKPRGRELIKNLKVFISVPDEIKGQKFERIKAAENRLKCKSISLGKVCRHFGWEE